MHAHLTVSLHLQTGFQEVSLELLPDEMNLMVSRLRWLVPSEFHKHLTSARCLPTRYAASALLHIRAHRRGKVAIGNDGQPVV